MNIVMLGAPGSGKGTQSAFLKEKYQMQHISTGDLLRDIAKLGSELGLQIKNLMAQGKYIDDDLMFAVLRDALRGDLGGIIFDGFPRTLEQIKMLDEFLSARNEKVNLVFEFRIAEKILLDRLQGRLICSECKKSFHSKLQKPKVENICDDCGGSLIKRADDDVEAIVSRFRIYNEQTAPIIEIYRERGLVIDVDASLSMGEVSETMVKKISNAQKA